MQLAPSALHTTAEALAHLLGPWETADPDHDGTIHLHGPLERHIGMRLLDNGSTIQLWATGGTQPTGHQHTGDTAPLPGGHRWHTPVHIGSLTQEQDPATAIYTAINDNLLPVFDTKPNYVGHRPWEHEAEINAEATAQTAAAAGVDVNVDDQPQPEPQAPTDELAAKRTTKTRRTKPETPAAVDPKPRPARKRAAAKAEILATAEPKPRPARKRTAAKPTPS